HHLHHPRRHHRGRPGPRDLAGGRPDPRGRHPGRARRRSRLPLLALDHRAAQRPGEHDAAERRCLRAGRCCARAGPCVVRAVRRPGGTVTSGGPAMTTPLTREPLTLLRDHARLPGAEHLLDPVRLSALLGREVRLERVRIKPGASVLVSFRTLDTDAAAAAAPAGAAPGAEVDVVGWAVLVLSRDKRDNALRRAARHGAEVREHPLPSALPSTTGGYLLSGGLDSDPRLGSEAARVLRREESATPVRVLSYNPARHAVLLLPGTGEVVRVAVRPLDPVLQVVERWRELGLPTLEQRLWRERSGVLVSRQWGDGDLAALAAHPRSMTAAAHLGGVIARLHAADVTGRDLPEARLGALVPQASEAVSDLLPHRAAQIQRLSARLHGVLDGDAPAVLIHGDLSPDQVLASADQTAVPGEGCLPLRVVDLDRSGLGPAQADLGSWIASCLLAGVEEQA